jgi:hypothetical protein
MAFISFNSRVAEHRTRLVCLGETPSPRVRCQLALFTYLLTYLRDRTPTASVYLTRLSYLRNDMELESGCEKKRLAVLR